ncbi:MAG: hypothetical protein Q4G42_08865 [Neisseria sp.]|nr:hypothetical protein [Neisseria sp.]
MGLLQDKLHNADYIALIERTCRGLENDEIALLNEILAAYDFDIMQEQALVQSVLAQARFDPNAGHMAEEDDDEDNVGICPHCINPPMPPLVDYRQWRENNKIQG